MGITANFVFSSSLERPYSNLRLWDGREEIGIMTETIYFQEMED